MAVAHCMAGRDVQQAATVIFTRRPPDGSCHGLLWQQHTK